MKIPIACSLTEPAAQSQLEEWRALLAAAATATARPAPTDVLFRLRDDPSQVLAILRLAQREKACCAFFDFAIVVDTDGLALRVSAPAEAATILDDFARLAG
jgi:hypothetical protein